MPTIERQGASTVPATEYYPRVIGGTCEFCGVINNQSDSPQYLLCPHFKNIGPLRCSYCPETRNPAEVVTMSTMNVHGHPDNPSKLVVVCSDFTCTQKHEQRFKANI